MSSSHPLRAVSIRRDRASSPSAASQIHTGGFLGRLHRMGKTSLKTLRRSARKTGAMAKPPAKGAERPCTARQTCQGRGYSRNGGVKAREHRRSPAARCYRGTGELLQSIADLLNCFQTRLVEKCPVNLPACQDKRFRGIRFCNSCEMPLLLLILPRDYS